MIVEYLERRNNKRPYSVPEPRWLRWWEQKRNTSKPHRPICSSLARTSCFPFHQFFSSVSLSQELFPKFTMCLSLKNTRRARRNRLAYYPNQGALENDNNLLTNCSGPPSRGRKFQVTVKASPTGAKLEKVHFNRTSVPLTASSTREV